MSNMVHRLKVLRNAVAAEIDSASRSASVPLFDAVVRAREALNDALAAAGDPEAIAAARTHCSSDEMDGIVGDWPGGMSP